MGGNKIFSSRPYAFNWSICFNCSWWKRVCSIFHDCGI